MPTKYLHLVRDELNPEFVRYVLELLNEAYKRSYEVAKAEHESNVGWHLGMIRAGKTHDVLMKAALAAGFNASSVPATNGLTHTEVLTPRLVIVPKKVCKPGDTGDATYRNHLCMRNSVLTLFDALEEVPVLEGASRRIFIELTHGPLPGKPEELGFAYFNVPDEEGNNIDYFPLDSLYPFGASGDGGIEDSPDGVWPTPRVGGARGAGGGQAGNDQTGTGR
jgi:hypothetical protein